MTDVVIPVKDLALAKSRLSPGLAEWHRKGLVLAMLGDLLGALARLDGHRTHVVSACTAVFDVARHHGAHCISEGAPRGYNGAIELAFACIADDRNVAVLPCDIPLAGVDEIARLIEPVDGHNRTVRLVPDHSGSGTNGLFLSKRNLIAPSFGVGSLARHVEASRAAGVEPDVLNLAGMALDIDTFTDLSGFAARCSDGAACRYVRTIGDDLSGNPATSRGAA